MLRTTFLIFALSCVAALPGCRKFPEVAVSEQQFDAKTRYPDLVPVEELLQEPEASITPDVQSELTTRRDGLLSTEEADPLEETKDPVLDRVDALREKRDAEASNEPIIDPELRKRLEGGITPPTLPE